MENDPARSKSHSDAYAAAQRYASLNSAFLRARRIGVSVTSIYADPTARAMHVTVAAGLSSLMPGVLQFRGVYRVTGVAEARRVKGR